MIRGTTAYFKFIMPYDYDQLDMGKVIFWQKYNNGPSDSRPLPIIKDLKEDCASTDVSNELVVSLHPEETARFSENRKAYTQLIAKTLEGQSFASEQHMITVYPIHEAGLDNSNAFPAVPDGE